MIVSKGRHVLGKLSRNLDKHPPRNCEAVLTWELSEAEPGKPKFSAQGEVWNHLKTDIVSGGQCVDTLAKLFPHDKLAQRICETWSQYHMNDTKAGTPEQEAALEAGLAEYADGLRNDPEKDRLFYSDGSPNWHAIAARDGKGSYYDISCAILEKAGLLDVPVTDTVRSAALGGLPEGATTYRYGSRWLYSSIPAEVIALIKRGFQDAEGEPLAADPAEAGEPERDLIAEAGLTIKAEFIPFSQSRNKKEKHPSLNWRVTVQCKGRDVLTCDYSQGSAHCPAYKRKDFGNQKSEAIRRECETGRRVKNIMASIGHFIQDKEPLQPTIREVLHSLLLDSAAINSGGFKEWCSEYGYETDSVKARAVYDECLSHAVALRGAVGPAMFESLMEATT